MGRETNRAKKETYHVVGLMSGTSLDGLDLAWCRFEKDRHWTYDIRKAQTVPYNASWRERLSGAHELPSSGLLELHQQYGRFLGQSVARFLEKHDLPRPDFIASHGHTIFHQPDRGFTFQLGDGAALHASSGLPVVFDFRSLDVARGGEGAPLVPVGDALLFGGYDICLNLGGIANLSMNLRNKRTAFDVCFCNMGLNLLAQEVGLQYDKGGARAASGILNPELFRSLLFAGKHWQKTRPSLGREIFESSIKPLLANQRIPVADRLCTFVEFIAAEVASAVPSGKRTMLVTGGGAWNHFLIHRMHERMPLSKIIVPDDRTVSFKEALIFAFLGVLSKRGEANCLKSVTGARQDSCSGVRIG